MSGDSASGGALTIETVPYYLTNAGVAVFTDGGTPAERIFTKSGSTLRRINGPGYLMPGGGVVSSIASVAANGGALTAFRAHTSRGTNLYAALERNFVALAVQGGSYAGEEIWSVGPGVINDRGDVGFYASTEAGPGMYLATRQGNGHRVARIAKNGGAAPGGGSFINFGTDVLVGGAGDKPTVVVFRASHGNGTGLYMWTPQWDPLESTCRHASLSIL